MTTPPLAAGSKVRIVKGCQARNLSKGARAFVRTVTPMGAEYSHMVRIVIVVNGLAYAFWARHVNRLSDPTVALNDGNPSHVIRIERD